MELLLVFCGVVGFLRSCCWFFVELLLVFCGIVAGFLWNYFVSFVFFLLVFSMTTKDGMTLLTFLCWLASEW